MRVQGLSLYHQESLPWIFQAVAQNLCPREQWSMELFDSID